MAETNVPGPGTIADVLSQLTTDCDALVKAVDVLSRHCEEVRVRCETLDREHQSLLEAYERARREREDALRMLADLQLAYERLRFEREVMARGFRELQKAIQEDRDSVVGRIELVLHRLKAQAPTA